MKDKLTIVTFTHYWTHAPSTELIENTFDSIYSRLSFKGCRHIINYDMPEDNEKYREYYNNLLKLKDKYNSNIEITTQSIKNKKRSYIYSEIVDTINTPYVLFWEHDFILLKDIDITKIVNVMDNNKNINYIKFNKRKTTQTKSKIGKEHITIDGWLEDENIYDIPLTKTCGYSGIPHIERVDWFKSFCKKLIYTIPVKKQTSIERAMNIYLINKRKRFDENILHSKLGLYIYGNIGDGRIVEEITDFKSRVAWGSKEPNKEWREINDKQNL